MGLTAFEPSDGVVELYVDSARIAANGFTITLELGVQMLPVEEGEPPPVRRSALIRMSPQHALALRDILIKNLAKYEELVGAPIPYPRPD